MLKENQKDNQSHFHLGQDLDTQKRAWCLGSSYPHKSTTRHPQNKEARDPLPPSLRRPRSKPPPPPPPPAPPPPRRRGAELLGPGGAELLHGPQVLRQQVLAAEHLHQPPRERGELVAWLLALYPRPLKGSCLDCVLLFRD